MPKGGFRPSFGRGVKKVEQPRVRKETKLPDPDIVQAAINMGITPLEYMLAVLRDTNSDQVRRDRMAMAAAPYCHPRMADNRVGKKDTAKSESKTAAQAWIEELDGDEIRPS